MKVINTEAPVKTVIALAAFDKLSDKDLLAVSESCLLSLLNKYKSDEYPAEWILSATMAYTELITATVERRREVNDRPRLTVIQGDKVDDDR